MQVLLQYQSKSYYIIGQEVYYSIGRFITLSGSYYIIGHFYYIIGQLLQYRAFITLSVGTPLPVKYQIDVTAFQVILDGPHEDDYVVFNGATCGRTHTPQHDTSIDDDSICYSVDPT